MEKPDFNAAAASSRLPPRVSPEIMNKYGIRADKIRSSCLTDIDSDANYRQGLLLLCEDSLFILKSAELLHSNSLAVGEKAVLSGEVEVDIIPLSSITAISVEAKISSVAVAATVNGAERLLANASNRCAGEVRKLVREIERELGIAPQKTERDVEREPFAHKAHFEGAARGPFNRGPMPPQAVKQQGGIIAKIKRLFAARNKDLFLRLMSFFGSYKASVACVLLCFAATSAISLASPYLSGTVLYGKVLGEESGLSADRVKVALAMLVAVMIAVKLLTQLFNMLHSLVTARFVPKVVRDIKNQVFDAMNRLSISFFQSRETGMLMTRVLDDADQVTTLFIDMLPSVLVGVITILIAIVIMLSVNLTLAAVAIVLLPLSALLSALLMSRLWTLHGRLHRANRKLSSAVNDNIVGARVVRAFGKQEGEIGRFSSTNEGVRGVQIDIVNLQSRLTAIFSFVNGLVPMLVMAAAGYLILNKIGDMNYATLLTFTGYVGMLSGPIDTVASFLREWASCMNSAQRIFEIIDARPEVAESESPVHIENISGEVELRGVCFAYDKGNPVLTDVSFKVEQGKMLGIVGRSGAGKSTLLNLITRLYDVGEGQVLIDGVDIRDIAFADLRGLVALVSQETYIFMGTVAENIAYACPDATPVDIVKAAKAACAHDFIMKLPDGYDTIIGTAGRQLSGGERQRLSIARAVLVNPRILMLDEATAAVDTETELNIQMALEELVKGRTTISVAHRLSTLRDADELIVIENGKIAERGTHSELMAGRGIYYTLAEIQRKALEYRGIGG